MTKCPRCGSDTLYFEATVRVCFDITNEGNDINFIWGADQAIRHECNFEDFPVIVHCADCHYNFKSTLNKEDVKLNWEE